MKSLLKSAAAAVAKASSASTDIAVNEFQSLPANPCPAGQYPPGEVRLTLSPPEDRFHEGFVQHL